jgi:uncharacterized membrane protein
MPQADDTRTAQPQSPFRKLAQSFHQPHFLLLLMLLLSSALSVALSLFRIWYSDTPHFIFLNWNLVLAWIPLALAYLLWRLDHSRRRRPHLLLLALFGSWLLFFPNSPYIVSDLMHITARDNVPLWFDATMIFSFAWNGLIVGFVSLWLVQQVVAHWGSTLFNTLFGAVPPHSSGTVSASHSGHLSGSLSGSHSGSRSASHPGSHLGSHSGSHSGSRSGSHSGTAPGRVFGALASWFFVAAALAATGFGVYLGRFQRWNSWDILVDPLGMARQVLIYALNPFDHPRTLGVTLLFAAFLFVAYLTITLLPAAMAKTLAPEQSEAPPPR